MASAVAKLDKQAHRNASGTGQVTFKITDDMETKNFPDMAFYHMLRDAWEAEETIILKVKPVFKPNTKHPLIDTLDIDKELVVKLLYYE